MAIRTQRKQNLHGSVLSRSLNRVRKYFGSAGTRSGASESFRQPVIPPAPLTGDVGRDRGDAGRALLFAEFKELQDSAPPPCGAVAATGWEKRRKLMEAQAGYCEPVRLQRFCKMRGQPC
jgi:hypothetical protein